MVSQVKLIAEPWDIGEGGYQVGNFPGLWTEWNGKYRDTVRDYWRGEPATLGEFASRLTGSSDLYEATGRRPSASINFVTCHDGFTLADLVSYNEKHNEANGEDNRDGESHNRSWNCGVEGPTDDPEILALRGKQMRNIMGTLMLSQGTPMIAHGDEIGRTQSGNNNVYCQDSEISWMDWSLCDKNADQLDFTRKVIELRKRHPVFRRRRFFEGEPIRTGDQVRDIAWLTPAGTEMTQRTGIPASSASRCSSTARRSPRPTSGANGWSTTRSCCASTPTARRSTSSLPATDYAEQWTAALDTADPTGAHRPGGRRRARSSRCRRGRCWCCVRPPSACLLRCCRRIGCRCAATPFTFADAENLLRLPRRPRGVAPVPVPDPDRGAGFDARIRRHRPHHGLGRARRRRRAGAAVVGGAVRAAWA